MIIRPLLPILALILVISTYPSIDANAQCAVVKKREEVSTVYIEKLEKLYINEDFENGVIRYDIRLFKMVYDSLPGIKIRYIECLYSNINSPKDVVPRAFGISFTNGGSIQLKAEKEGPVKNGSDGLKQRRFVYPVIPDIQTLLLANDIQIITIIDTRTGQTIVTKPYSGLLMEQLKCLDKD